MGPVSLKDVIGVAISKKRCSKCQKLKSVGKFGLNKKCKDGRSSWCRECNNQQTREWRNANPEKVRAGKKKYRAENRCKIREYRRKHPSVNGAKAQRQQKEWRAANVERNRKLKTDWRIANIEKVRTYERHRRAVKQFVLECFTNEEAEFVRAFWDNRCVICGRTPGEEGKALAIDHWHPLSKGNPLTISNAVLLCLKHNSQKGANQPTDVFDAKTIRRIERKIKAQVRAWNKRLDKAKVV